MQTLHNTKCSVNSYIPLHSRYFYFHFTDKGTEERQIKPKVTELLRAGAAILTLAVYSSPCSNLQAAPPNMEQFKDRLPCSLCSFLYNPDYLCSHIQLLTPLPSNLTLPNKA